jgi:hypothetical protein
MAFNPSLKNPYSSVFLWTFCFRKRKIYPIDCQTNDAYRNTGGFDIIHLAVPSLKHKQFDRCIKVANDLKLDA